ncbi:MAG: tyrosine-protein phosphatase [Chromatiales bacterium]|nr:tyrosine-protein phosphatase [Chromatiales bacterium]
MVEFRSVSLPPGIRGALFLHSMPGRRERLEQAWDAVTLTGISCIVCLADIEEIQRKSPQYAEAVIACTVPCERVDYPIVDYGVPSDKGSFLTTVRKAAERLQAGKRLLVHCGAGIGRTGTFATCVLLALGVPLEEAKRAVSSAGSAPETSEQRGLVNWYASQASGKGR